MKGKSKYIIPLILAGVTATAGVAPTINQFQNNVVVHAEENTENENTQVNTSKEITDVNGATLGMTGGFKDTYQLGEVITMPTVATTEGDFDIVYKIYRGSKVVATIKGDDATKEFKPSYTGAYNVVITAEKEGTVVTELKNLTIMVEKTDATIVLPVNSQYVIPAQLPVSNTKGLTIPAPKVMVDDKEVTLDSTHKLIVSLVTPSATAGIIPLTLTDGVYKVTDTQLATPGTYQIRYEYREYANEQDENGTLISKLETNFQVVKNLEAPESLHLKLSGSVPSTGDVNTEIKIPKVTVLDSKSSTDGINAHVTVKVTRLNSDGTPADNGTEIDYENYTFTPSAEGNYKVTYHADLNSIYSGVESTQYSPATIIKVADKKNPTVMPTYSYQTVEGVSSVDFDGDGTFEYELKDGEKLEDVLKNRKVDVPSIAVRKDGVVKFTLPAIFGTDNKEIKTLERQIVGNNISKQTYNNDVNKAVEVETDKLTGTNYEIRYIATDKDGNTLRATYSLVVKDAEDLADGETTVKLNTGVSTITDGETLRFSAPTATDTYDSNVDVVTGYRLMVRTLEADGKTYKYEEITGYDKELKELNSDNKYEIKIADLLDSTVTSAAQGKDLILRVYAKATADATLKGTRTAFADDTTTEVYKDIKVIDSSKDTAHATLSLVGEYDNWNNALLEINKTKTFNYKETKDEDGNVTSVTAVEHIGKDGYAYKTTTENADNAYTASNEETQLAAFDQGKSVITLPTLKFADEDENLRLTLTITDKSGNTVTKETYEKIAKEYNKVTSKYEYTIDSASFKLSASGVYTVTYRAEDTAGNCLVKSYGIRVNDKTAPTIVIDDEDKYGVDVEVGKFFEVPYGTLIKDGKVEEGEVYWDVTYSDGAECEIASTGFTPLTEGTYYITYYGTDNLDNSQILQDNSLFFVNAKDTTAPVFNDDSSYVLPPVLAWGEDAEEVEVKIPVVYATDPIREQSVDVVYTVTSPDGTKVTVKDYEEDSEDVKYFVAKSQGVYTITYTATDSANNKVTMTKQVSVGDCEAPEIEWTDDYKIDTEKKLGDKLELKLKYLNITDNETTDKEYLQDNMTISLLKPDGTTKVSNKGTDGVNYIWDLTETGSYTLRIVVEDKAGQSQTYKYTVNVAAEDAEDNVVSSVVGTVLVIVSVVILAGVVIYFVVSSRKKAAPRPSKSKKKD